MPNTLEPILPTLKRHAHRVGLALLTALLATVGSAPAVADEDVPKATATDAEDDAPTLESLLEMEAATESFVRHLIDLAGSVSPAGTVDGGSFFAERVERRPLSGIVPGAVRPEGGHPWVEHRPWTVTGDVEAADRATFARELTGLFGWFSSIEHVGFDVTGSTVPSPERVHAEVELEVVGRDRDGRREWLQGTATVDGRRSAPEGETGEQAEGWRITSFVIETLDSLVTPHDIFREVSAAAAVAASDPPLAETLPRAAFWYPHGAAVRDVDDDGLLDLFATGPEGNHLYLNQGDGTFRDVAARAGLKVLAPDRPEFVPVFLDFDNDGDADLFVTSHRSNLLLENRRIPDGRLTFRDVSLGLPQVPECQSWTVAVGDADGDGLPDLYIPCYGNPLDGPGATTTVDDTAGRPNLFYLNRGDGRFEEVAEAWGVADSRFGMGAQFTDIDGDHDLDLFLANDFGGGNALFVNQGDKFVDRADELGVGQAGESMGVSFADYDNDGDLDLHVTNMSSTAANRALDRYAPDSHPLHDHLRRIWSGNTLFENQGDGTFRDVSDEAGPFLGGWAWGGGFLDLDNDGWEDLHTPNGHLSGSQPYDTESMLFSTIIAALGSQDREQAEATIGAAFEKHGELLVGHGYSFSGHQRDLVLLNLGGRYLDISGVSGADAAGDGWAPSYADFDNDGDYDVFLRGAHGTAHLLFVNRLGQENRSLRVSLEGTDSGRDAFGAQVRVAVRHGEETLRLTKVKHGSNGYLAQSDPRILFGLGPDGQATEIEVRWPSGRVQSFSGPFEARSLAIVEGAEAPEPVEEQRFRLPDGPAATGGDAR